MTRQRFPGLLAAAFFLACSALSASAQQQQPTPRSRDTRGSDQRTAHFRCLSQTTTAYSDYAGPQSAREYGETAYVMACIVNAMPEDWNAAGEFRKQADAFADIARRADPGMDGCLLSACPLPPEKMVPAK